MTVQPIYTYNNRPSSNQRKKTEQVAAGVGGAAGATTTVHNMAAKRGLYTRFQQTMSRMTSAASKVNQNAEVATSLWGKFKLNTKVITKDFLAKFKALENNKIYGAIFKNALVKKSAGVFGGVLAFFALVSGVNKAAKTSLEAAGDIRSKFADIRA